jgi:hypothetical protein
LLLPPIKLGIGHHLRSDLKADFFICQSSLNIDINIANRIHGLFDIHFRPTRDKDAQVGALISARTPSTCLPSWSSDSGHSSGHQRSERLLAVS